MQFLWAVGGSLRSVSAPWIYLASVTLRGHSPQKLFPLNAPTRRVYNVVKHFELGAIVRFLCGPKYKLVLQSFLETELSRNILYKCLGSRHVHKINITPKNVCFTATFSLRLILSGFKMCVYFGTFS